MSKITVCFIPQAVGSLLSKKELRTQLAEVNEAVDPSSPLTFLATLVKALHSVDESYPLDSLVLALSESQLRATLFSSFECVLLPGNPALVCSVKAVEVLLCKLRTHWKVC